MFISFLSIGQSCDTASEVIDLASDTEWKISIDDTKIWRSIKVPGGGYNSDIQSSPLIDGANIKDHVTYKRGLTIPHFNEDQIVKLRFGAVNHGCEVFIDDLLIATHVGPHMPFEADITSFVKQGGDYVLKVISYPQWHYKYKVPHGFVYAEARNGETRAYPQSEPGWSTKFGYGITRYVQLVVQPALQISDVFVQPLVKSNTLTYEVWIKNASHLSRRIIINSLLDSWNGMEWPYPKLPIQAVTLKANEEKKITIGPLKWNLGKESYWWPNKPFNEDYKAQLHNLEISISEAGEIIDKVSQRFGFVEWSEGPFYYMVNGVRFNHISDGTPEAAMSEYDCYTTSPAFLPPTDSTKGCPETWKKFMRLGINTSRIHQSTPTDYMMDAADELGFVLVNETAIRGCQQQEWDSVYLPQATRELALLSRNHPSVCRYSVHNEAPPGWVPVLIDTLMMVDHTRPIVFEDNQLNKPARINGRYGHAYAMLHYTSYPKPATMITGMGEYAWNWPEHAQKDVAEGGLNEFLYYGGDMRRWDIAYFAGWDFLNYWPNFLEGMNRQKHAWKQSVYHRDRSDGVDGWNSPVTDLIQKYFHPYLMMDIDIHNSNKISSSSDLSLWPMVIPSYMAGSTIKRKLEMFNDGLKGELFTILIHGRWDTPVGPIAFEDINIEAKILPGFHRTVEFQIKAPAIKSSSRKLYLIYQSILDNKIVFEENKIHLYIYQ